jgi:Domain found in Dishevelled, Egl-10, and Pleckstrin (DEP)
MLILTPSDVESCFVQLPGNLPSFGFRYQSWYFRFGNFLRLDFQEALLKSGQWLDNPQEPGEIRALLRETKGCRLCIHLPELQHLSEDVAMEVICEQMRTSGQLKIGPHRYQLRVYQKTFIGSEAVTWLAENLLLSREEAVELGRKCLQKDLFTHIWAEHNFEDNNFFYRFAKDGGPERDKSFILTY